MPPACPCPCRAPGLVRPAAGPARSRGCQTVLAGLLFIALAALGSGCSRSGSDDLLAPDLDPTVSRLLSQGRTAELANHFRAAGTGDLLQSFETLYRAVVFADGTPGDSRDRTLRRHLTTLADLMADGFDVALGRYKVASIERLDRAVLREAYEMNHHRDLVFADPSVPDSTKVVQFEAMAGFFEQYGLLWYSVALEESLAQLHAGLGEREAMRIHLRRALARSREVDFAGMTCQILGTMAEIFSEEGEADSALVYVDHLQDRAVRSRLALQAARAETFRCSLSLDQGRLHAAHLHLKEARQLCREFQGGPHEVIYVTILARFYANLGCWSIVECLLEQTDLLLASQVPDFLQPTAVDLALLKAETLFERGRRADAHRMTAEILAGATPRPYRMRYARIAWTRARLLLADHHPDEALPVVREGLRRASEDNLPGMDRAFTLQLADALEQQGQAEGARAALDRFRLLTTADDDLMRGDLERAAALDIRLAWTSHGDGPELVTAVARGFAALERRLTTRDPSAHTYLHLQGFDDLRVQVHRFVADDPALGLGFELAWRRLARLRNEGSDLGRIGAPFDGPMPRDIAAWVALWTERVNGRCHLGAWLTGKRPAPAGSTLLMYALIGDDLIRWQSDAGGVRRERLDLAAHGLRQLVARALDRLAVPPADDNWNGSGPLADDLAVLARELIPGDLRRGWLGRRPGADRKSVV